MLTVWSLLLLLLCILPNKPMAADKTVFVIPVNETVENGLYAFLERGIDTALKKGASAIIFEINTPGGVVAAAEKIAKLMDETPVKKIAFINNKALSAGAYISLHADEIYMVPSGTIGSAAIIDSAGNAASKKAQSYWLAAMKTAAENNGRDPKFALAMASEKNELDAYGAGNGKLLTLNAAQARTAGYSEGTVKDQEELLSALNLAGAKVTSINETFAEKAARFLTHPAIIPILLTIGCLGIVIELFTPGIGLPGLIGFFSFLLFFFGHMVAGLTGYESIFLFGIGIILLILELFLPGAIAGVLGFACIAGSLYLATGNLILTSVSLLIALTVSIGTAILMIKVYGKKMRMLNKIILNDSTATDKGYVSNKNRIDLIGREGLALTALRPSGIALIDNERVDVVSEGNFIASGVKIKVMKAEGARIVVREAVE
nr:NfeD family protein [Peribacillus deserti]